MAENDEPTGADDTVVQETVPAAAPAPEPAPSGFTSRVWSFRAMVAVALASLVIGGGIGSAIAAVSGDDEPDHMIRIGRFDGGPGGGERRFMERAPGLPGPEMREFHQEFPDGLDDEALKEMRRKMRQEMRDQMQEWRKELQEQGDANEDAPDASPSPSAS